MEIKVKKIDETDVNGNQYYESRAGGLFMFVPERTAFGRVEPREWYSCLSYSGEAMAKIDETKLQIIIEGEV